MHGAVRDVWLHFKCIRMCLPSIEWWRNTQLIVLVFLLRVLSRIAVGRWMIWSFHSSLQFYKDIWYLTVIDIVLDPFFYTIVFKL